MSRAIVSPPYKDYQRRPSQGGFYPWTMAVRRGCVVEHLHFPRAEQAIAEWRELAAGEADRDAQDKAVKDLMVGGEVFTARMERQEDGFLLVSLYGDDGAEALAEAEMEGSEDEPEPDGRALVSPQGEAVPLPE